MAIAASLVMHTTHKTMLGTYPHLFGRHLTILILLPSRSTDVDTYALTRYLLRARLQLALSRTIIVTLPARHLPEMLHFLLHTTVDGSRFTEGQCRMPRNPPRPTSRITSGEILMRTVPRLLSKVSVSKSVPARNPTGGEWHELHYIHFRLRCKRLPLPSQPTLDSQTHDHARP